MCLLSFLFLCLVFTEICYFNFDIIKAAESVGCDGGFIIATNIFTNVIAKNIGMKLYHTVYWKDYHGWFDEKNMACPDVNSYYKFFF